MRTRPNNRWGDGARQAGLLAVLFVLLVTFFAAPFSASSAQAGADKDAQKAQHLLDEAAKKAAEGKDKDAAKKLEEAARLLEKTGDTAGAASALDSASAYYQQVDPTRAQVLADQATNLTATATTTDQMLARSITTSTTTQSSSAQSTSQSAPHIDRSKYSAPDALKVVDKANADIDKKWNEGKQDEARKLYEKGTKDADKKQAEYDKKHAASSGGSSGAACTESNADYKFVFKFADGRNIDGHWCGGNTVDPAGYAQQNNGEALNHVGQGGLHVSCSDDFYTSGPPYAKKSDLNAPVQSWWIAKMKNGQVSKSCPEGPPPSTCAGPLNVLVVNSQDHKPVTFPVSYTTTVGHGNANPHSVNNGNSNRIGTFDCGDASAQLTHVPSGWTMNKKTDSGTIDAGGLTLTLSVTQVCTANVNVQVIDKSTGKAFTQVSQISVTDDVGVRGMPEPAGSPMAQMTGFACDTPVVARMTANPSSPYIIAKPYEASGKTPKNGGTTTLTLYVDKSQQPQCTGPLTIYVRDADSGALVKVGGASATVNGTGHGLDNDAVTKWSQKFDCGVALNGTLDTPPNGYVKVVDTATATATQGGAQMTFTVRQPAQVCTGPLTVEVRDSRTGQLVPVAGAKATYAGSSHDLSKSGRTDGGTYNCDTDIDGTLTQPPHGYVTVVGQDSVRIDRNGETLTFFVRPQQPQVCTGPLTIEVVDTTGNHVGGGEATIETPSTTHTKKLETDGFTPDASYDCGTRIDGTLTTPPTGYTVVSGSDNVLMDSNGETLRFVVRKQTDQVCVGPLNVEVRNSETGALVEGTGATGTFTSGGHTKNLDLQSDGDTPVTDSSSCGTSWHGTLLTPPVGYQIVVDEDTAVIDENGETLTFYVRPTPDQACKGPLTIRVVDDHGALVKGGVVLVDGRLMEVTNGEIVLPGQHCGQMTVVLTDWPDNTEALEPTVKTPVITPEGAVAEFVVVPADVGGVVIERPPSGPLPRTGGDLAGIALLAIAVLGAGGLLVGLSRRRRHTA